jgi:hypothetical protein
MLAVRGISRAPNAAASALLGHALIGFRGSYAPALSENRNSFLRLLKNKDFKEERMTKVGLYAIGSSTTLESNKSLCSISACLLFCSIES